MATKEILILLIILIVVVIITMIMNIQNKLYTIEFFSLSED